jgi:hypothetical protein
MRQIGNVLWDFVERLGSLEDAGATARGGVFGPDRRRLFYPSGRAALAAVLKSLGLRPEDEVLLANSSGQTYIVSCVTCSVFNYCKPSRVLTDSTRAMLIIHEYGVPHPRLKELCAIARERRIPVIEDCAHAFDSRVDGRAIGTFGDYAIYSQPKSLPLPRGGILAGDSLDAITDRPEPGLAREIEAEFAGCAPLLPVLSERRRRNFRAVREAFPHLPALFELAEGVTPFLVGLRTPDNRRIRAASDAVAWASTMDPDLLLIPTNPLVEPEELVEAVRGASSRSGQAASTQGGPWR